MGVSKRPSDDSDETNSMELDESSGDEPEDADHDSGAELRHPIDRIDRECFDALSAWLSKVSLTCSAWNRRSFKGLAKCFRIESTAQISC